MKINVHRPLKNAVSLVRESKRQIYRVKYERLPDWCAVCGHLGHTFKEHDNGIHPPQAPVFKDVRASWIMRRATGPGGERGRRGGRRGGRGRGNRGTPRSDSEDFRKYDDHEGGLQPSMEDMAVDDPSRKRMDRKVSGKNAMVPGKQQGEPSATDLAIVPVGDVVSPLPPRDPKW